MRDHEVAGLLDHAVATVELPPGLAHRVITRSRTRRRRRLLLSGGTVAVVVAAGALVLPQLWPAGRGGGSEGGGTGPSAAADVPAGIVGPDGRRVPLAQVVAVGRAGTETLVLIRREPRAQERAAGGQAVEVLVAPDAGEPRRLLDYLSYDLACVDGDAVCAAVRSTSSGLGVAVARRSGGRLYVLVQAPQGRTVEVVANGVPHPLGAAPQGAVVEVVAAEPYEDVQVWASTEDGRRYQIPWAPGAVLVD
ncbi:hypothetical protein [Micromonospora parathelypteridis]|uniref:Uncharacterized protein n=1 Tax=Micromonospora parathelypteridis TaxID=1839617 RepID=A0A840W6T3_9ACTN|nr:hypothetical protein [Micromonospora parathelypteridis]MBB5479889.1 hypothetical protein [Micromonospora parathelypteridis]GGO26042.1 hypothetical protein GCM10011576_49250 [Micromonospora parathelypteridis]